jgi:purine-binding chemotaxis protein CheW
MTVASYLTFRLGDELFATDVVHVREILDLCPVTKIPTAPPYLLGLVNVRGTAVPVVDLRAKFGLPRGVDTVQSRIVVLELPLDGEPTVVGGLADAVLEVLELDHEQLREAPRLAMRWRADMIRGIARKAEQFVIVLDLVQVLASDHELLADVAAST